MDLSLFESSIDFVFKNKNFLNEALTHRSYLNENPSWGLSHNERLEFLGDAVLELAVTEELFNIFPQKPEGELTSYRAALVNAVSLFEIAKDLNLGDFILLSKGESKDINSKGRQFIIANALEALIGAIYLDQGYDSARRFINKFVMPKLPGVIENKLYKDAKSLFQEKAQERVAITPNYKVLGESGPDHNKVFILGVFLKDELVAKGEGSSKQEGELDAARKALEVKGWL